MNVTLLALSLSRGVMSPLFANTKLTASKVQMTRQFSPFFFASSVLSTLKLSSSTFVRTLAAPIVIDHADADYSGKKFSETLVLGDDKRQWTIKKCIFSQCQSEDNGGGLSVSNADGTVVISNSGFLKCSGQNGGAIYTDTAYVEMNDVCVGSCSADKYPGYYLSVSKTTSLSHCHVSKIADEEVSSAIAGIVCDGISIKNTNFSGNNAPESKAICYLYGKPSGGTINAEFLNFDRSTSLSILWIQCSTGQNVETANFVKNTGKDYMIELEAWQMKLVKLYVRNDQSQMYINRFCVFESCVFDASAKEAEAKFTSNPSTKDCSFGKDKTVDVKIHNSIACWGNPKTDSQDDSDWGEEESGSAGLTIGIIALVAVLGVIGYFAYNKLFRRRGTDTHLLMYV